MSDRPVFPGPRVPTQFATLASQPVRVLPQPNRFMRRFGPALGVTREGHMWESGFSFGVFFTTAAWVGAVLLVACDVVGLAPVADLGLVCAAAAAALTVMRDNARTRKVVRLLARQAAPVRGLHD